MASTAAPAGGSRRTGSSSVRSGYAVAFIDDSKLAAAGGLRRSLFAFGNPLVQSGFAGLVGKAGRRDSTFDLLLEGWSLQTLARLGNLHTGPAGSGRPGSLPPSCLRRVSEFVRDFYGSPLSVRDLAAVAGYSERHVARAFRDSTGRTPMKFVTEVRIERAKEMLLLGLRDGGHGPRPGSSSSCWRRLIPRTSPELSAQQRARLDSRRRVWFTGVVGVIGRKSLFVPGDLSAQEAPWHT